MMTVGRVVVPNHPRNHHDKKIALTKDQISWEHIYPSDPTVDLQIQIDLDKFLASAWIRIPRNLSILISS